jgi:hypothetical protein
MTQALGAVAQEKSDKKAHEFPHTSRLSCVSEPGRVLIINYCEFSQNWNIKKERAQSSQPSLSPDELVKAALTDEN